MPWIWRGLGRDNKSVEDSEFLLVIQESPNGTCKDIWLLLKPHCAANKLLLVLGFPHSSPSCLDVVEFKEDYWGSRAFNIIKYGIGLLGGEGSPLTSEEHGNPTPLIKNPSSKQQWEISHFEDSDTKVYVSPVYSIYYQVPLCPRLWIWLTQYPLLHPTYLIISWMEKLLSIQMIMKLFTPFILLACIVILFVSMVFTIHLYPHV